MKKQILICGLAALATTTMLFAANDKLIFYNNRDKVKTLRVDDISEITYSDKAENGFKTMRVTTAGADPVDFDLDEVTRIDYKTGLPDNPINITVTPHHMCASLVITSSDPNAFYRIVGSPVEDIKYIPEDDWADLLFNDDLEFCQGVAADAGAKLSDFDMSDIFYKGDTAFDWWPSSWLLPDEEAVLLAYTGKVIGNTIIMTTEPKLFKFRTKAGEMEKTEYDVDVEFSSNTYTVKAAARESEGANPDIPFFIACYSKEDVESQGLEALSVNTLMTLEQSIYRAGMTWADAMYYNKGERKYTNTRVGDEMVAVAYGCEYGIITTPFFTKEFTVPVPQKTSDATFDVTVDKISASEYSLSVTPSDPDLRWTGMLVESSALTDEYSQECIVSAHVKYLNNTNGWAFNDKLIKTGAVSDVSTQSGLLAGNFMTVGTEYSILLFGIDENGAVTTKIHEEKVTPTSSVSGLSLDISFSGFRESGNTNFLEANIVPDNKDAKYVFGYLPHDNSNVNLDYTDDEFIRRFVDVCGENLDMYTYSGDLNKIMSLSSKFNNTLGIWQFETYIAFAFGYDGEATSGLYVYRINAATGETEVIRQPAAAKELTFEVALKNFYEESATSNRITADIKPSDKNAKFVLDILPNELINSNMTDEEFVDYYVSSQGQYLNRMVYTGDTEKIFSMGQKWNSTLGMWVYDKYTIFLFGYDGEQTSRLMMWEVDAATGEHTLIRGGDEPAE